MDTARWDGDVRGQRVHAQVYKLSVLLRKVAEDVAFNQTGKSLLLQTLYERPYSDVSIHVEGHCLRAEFLLFGLTAFFPESDQCNLLFSGIVLRWLHNNYELLGII